MLLFRQLSKGIILRRCLFTLSILTMASCASNPFAPRPWDFFGMGVKDLTAAVSSFKVTSYSLEEGISYESVPSQMDPGIHVVGTLDSWGMELHVSNRGTTPIQTNYFLDTWMLADSVGKMYAIEKGSILHYPDSGAINPDQTVIFRLPWPDRRFAKHQIFTIGGELGGKHRLLILPLQTPD